MRDTPLLCPEPDCGKPLVPVEEQVDIGVGVQTFTTGYECPEHGGICGICNGCGRPSLDGYAHRSWCFTVTQAQEDLSGLLVYVVTLKTWQEYDRAHHTYARIHWANGDAGWGVADSETLPDADDITSIRHETRKSAIEGARRWYAANGKPKSALVIGTWTLLGFDPLEDFEILEKKT